MLTYRKNLLQLGWAHGLADAVTGFCAATLFLSGGLLHGGLVILCYNAIAFGLQPLFGYVVDRTQYYFFALFFGISVITVGLTLFQYWPIGGFFIIAVGSACFHVAGGAMAALMTPKLNKGAAVFTAPGVVGLGLGTVAGLVSVSITFHLFVLLFITLVVFSVTQYPYRAIATKSMIDDALPLATFVPVAMLLVLGVVFRSSVWSAVSGNFLNVQMILVIAVAAGVGKLAGGFFADVFGRRRIAFGTLFIALLCFTTQQVWFIVLGIFFLQSSTPIILSFIVQRMPKYPAVGTGLVLGSALFFGGILAYMLSGQQVMYTEVIAVMVLVAGLLFWKGLGRGERGGRMFENMKRIENG